MIREMALLQVLSSIILLISHLVLGFECLDYSTHEPYSSTNVSHGHGIDKPKRVCPPWKYQKHNDSRCVCGDAIDNLVLCDDNSSTVLLLTCHCMSYSEDDDNQIVMGACPYLCTNSFYSDIKAVTNLSNLCNRDIQQNRRGQMCGRCENNHSPSPYSYALKCADCSNHKYNWLKYLAIAYGPLTVFFIIIIVFRLNILSASMNAFIFVSQILSCPALLSVVSTYVDFSREHPVEHSKYIIAFNMVELETTLLAIWNLDFFRMLYKPFCLHPDMSIVQIKCLDYAVAVYPILLITMIYILFKLHEKFDAIQCLFRPFVWLCAHFSHQLKASTSLVEAFATFILLSYIKISNISFDILMPVQVRNVSGQVVGLYTYYNGSLEYFGHDHLPYALLAIFMFTVFNLLPLLLLCLYPCRCFQSCLNYCRLNSQVLRIFMDAFQGCYKFEPYDCRYWAAFNLFLRILVQAVFLITQSGYFVLIAGILMIQVVALVAIVRPYRQMVYNVVDIVLFLALVLVFFSCLGLPLCAFDRTIEGFVVLMISLGLLAQLIYISALTLYEILPKSLITHVKKCALHLPYIDRMCVHLEEVVEDRLLTHLEESMEYERSHLLCQGNVHTSDSGQLNN